MTLDQFIQAVKNKNPYLAEKGQELKVKSDNFLALLKQAYEQGYKEGQNHPTKNHPFDIFGGL